MASNRKRKKEKVVLVFDEKDRREYITGFRKRKNERRKIANEELRKKEEEKRKQTRAEKREALRNHIEETERNPDDIDSDQEVLGPTSITHDFSGHTVTVSAITDEDMGSTVEPAKNYPKIERVSDKVTKNNLVPTITPSRDKTLKMRKFRKKAQKRKIQGLSDKKTSKLRKTNSNKKKL